MATKQYTSIGDYYKDIKHLSEGTMPEEPAVLSGGIKETVTPVLQRQRFVTGFGNISRAATDFATRMALALFRKQAKAALVKKKPSLVSPLTRPISRKQTFGEIMAKKVAGIPE